MFLKTLSILLLACCAVLCEKTEGNVTLENGEVNIVAQNETEVPKQTYKEAEKEIMDFVNSILRSLLPRVVGGSGSADLSPKCTGAMMKIFGNVRRLKGWTLKLLDSMGKPPGGILMGASYSVGHYDQCLNLSISNKGLETTDPEKEMFGGMYCKFRIRFSEAIIETARHYHEGKVNASDLGKLKELIEAIPYVSVSSEYMNHFLGLCLPSTCNMKDVEELMKVVPFPGVASIDRCETRAHKEQDQTQLIIVCTFLFLISLAVVSTFIDWILHSGKDKGGLRSNDKRCVSVTVAFSFCNNTKKLVKHIEDDLDGLLSGQTVRGIMVASIAWLTLGYTYLFPHDSFYMKSSSLVNLNKYMEKQYFAFLVSYPLAIDALFVCFGFLLTFPLWYSSSKDQKVNVKVISLISHYWAKLCIPEFMALGVIVLLPLFGSGLFWGDFMEKEVQVCRKNAVAYVGMYSNYIDLNEQCFPHLWFVSCLAQLTLVGIILSWIMSKSMKFGVILLIAGTVACNATVGISTYNNDFPPSYVAYFTGSNPSSEFFKVNLTYPLSHFGPYAVGMLAGVLIARRIEHKIRACLAGIGWILCLSLLYGIIDILYEYRDGSMGTYWSAVYAGNHRTLFALCVAWVMVACAFGSGGFVNAILSWRIFDPLSKLSFFAYLFHVIVIAFVIGVSRERYEYSNVELILRAISYIAVTYALSYVIFMLSAMPIKALHDVTSPTTRQIDVTPLNNFNFHKGNMLSQGSVQGSCKLWSVTESKANVPF